MLLRDANRPVRSPARRRSRHRFARRSHGSFALWAAVSISLWISSTPSLEHLGLAERAKHQRALQRLLGVGEHLRSERLFVTTGELQVLFDANSLPSSVAARLLTATAAWRLIICGGISTLA